MSDPLSDKCAYCGSPDVLDDAWFCEHPGCHHAYQLDGKADFFEGRSDVLCKLMLACADKLEDRGNQEPLVVAQRLREEANRFPHLASQPTVETR